MPRPRQRVPLLLSARHSGSTLWDRRRRLLQFTLSPRRHLRRPRRTVRPICHSLLVINRNLGPISHRLRDTATYRFEIANFLYPHFILGLNRCDPFRISGKALQIPIILSIIYCEIANCSADMSYLKNFLKLMSVRWYHYLFSFSFSTVAILADLLRFEFVMCIAFILRCTVFYDLTLVD